MLLFKNLVKFRALIIFGFLDLFEGGVDDAEENVEENELEGDHDKYVDARSHVWVAIVHLVDHALVLHYDKYHSNDWRPDSAELLQDISVEKLAAAAVPKKHDHNDTIVERQTLHWHQDCLREGIQASWEDRKQLHDAETHKN